MQSMSGNNSNDGSINTIMHFTITKMIVQNYGHITGGPGWSCREELRVWAGTGSTGCRQDGPPRKLLSQVSRITDPSKAVYARSTLYRTVGSSNLTCVPTSPLGSVDIPLESLVSHILNPAIGELKFRKVDAPISFMQ